jgi:hypothetical protein
LVALLFGAYFNGDDKYGDPSLRSRMTTENVQRQIQGSLRCAQDDGGERQRQLQLQRQSNDDGNCNCNCNCNGNGNGNGKYGDPSLRSRMTT